MQTRIAAVMALLAWSAGVGFAHEAGKHTKIMGTVRSIDDREIVVETKEGKKRSVRVDEDTACADAEGDTTCGAVKEGDRVVVKTRGKGAVIAEQIRFSSGAKKR